MHWVEKSFAELSATELYRVLQLRQRVFVIEACIYLDVDGLDPQAYHLWTERDGEIVAYLRVLPAAVAFAEPSIGRVIIGPAARSTGLGRELMREGLTRTWQRFGPVSIRIGAQAHLERFYASLGFARASADYMDDGIRHLEMTIPAPIR
jgi:ElaA protein